MGHPLPAVVREGHIELLEPANLPEGSRVLILLPSTEESESGFWLGAAQESLQEIWDNPEDDVYAALLEK